MLTSTEKKFVIPMRVNTLMRFLWFFEPSMPRKGGAFRYTPIATMYGQSHSRQSPLIFYWAVIVVLVLFNIDSLKVGIGVSTKSIPFMWSRLFALDEACAMLKVGCIGLKKHLCRHYCLYLCHLFSTTYNVILSNQINFIMCSHHPVPFSVPANWYSSTS